MESRDSEVATQFPRQDLLATVIYASASVATSLCWVIKDTELALSGPTSIFLGWLLCLFAPLLFGFAYPKRIFSQTTHPEFKWKRILLQQSSLAGVAFFLFVALSPFSRNPARLLDTAAESMVGVLLWQIFRISISAVFLVAATTLLYKGKPTLCRTASVLFWPFWLMVGLILADRWIPADPIYAAEVFFFLISPIFFAFAAGTISYRPLVAHVSALIGIVSLPAIYLRFVKDTSLGNAWIVFNLTDHDLKRTPTPDLVIAALGVLCVATVALTITTAIIRLIPARATFRNHAISQRTAFGVTAVFLGAWFCHSVMPYRIPGAVDYADYPVFQILHVQKDGLQFHERVVSVYTRDGSFGVSGNDRRLLHYRFDEHSSRRPLPPDLQVRIAEISDQSKRKKSTDEIKPIRKWRADNWYVSMRRGGTRIYRASEGDPPPKEIVDLFDQLESLPKEEEYVDVRKDVCLGFCYDPLSEMGMLYANHRCFNDGKGTVCR